MHEYQFSNQYLSETKHKPGRCFENLHCIWSLISSVSQSREFVDILFYEFPFSFNPSENQLIYSHEMRDMMHSHDTQSLLYPTITEDKFDRTF